MSLLWRYLKHYKKTVFLAVFLAAVNQIFSLLDPQIFRYLIDRYATQIHSLSSAEFYRGVGVLLLLGVVSLALPFLQGILFILVGLFLLSTFSPTMREWIEKHTRRFPKVHEAVLKVQQFISRIIGEA